MVRRAGSEIAGALSILQDEYTITTEPPDNRLRCGRSVISLCDAGFPRQRPGDAARELPPQLRSGERIRGSIGVSSAQPCARHHEPHQIDD
jgi:hypothetical protein